MGYTNLSVSTVEKQLKISVTPDKTASYQPGQKAGFSIQATDYAGKPVEAEFSVALVDKAIQSLVDDFSVSPLKAFYGQRGLGVQTSATLWSRPGQYSLAGQLDDLEFDRKRCDSRYARRCCKE
jgi:uncharacterized protein YfaS (alpha-2-macroglobulin family)